MDGIKIVDTTLRDGEQTPGIAFSKAEKLQLARILDQAGVDEIEVGIPAMGAYEQETIRAIVQDGLRARILTWNRLVVKDIQASINCGASFVHLSAPVSDLHLKDKLGKSRSWLLDTLPRAIQYAQDFGCAVSVGAEDASRADQQFVAEFAEVAYSAGAQRLRYADTVGVLDPFSTRENIWFLQEHTKIPIEIHAHNDFGMALANSLAAIKAGVQFVSTTINGMGERAGNASLIELMRVVEGLYHQETKIDTLLLNSRWTGDTLWDSYHR